MTELQAELYLLDRASNEGISVDELIDMTPPSVADHPVESAMFWQQRHYSHIKPVSLYPELADDPNNAMPEDGSSNMSRGAAVMTEDEMLIADIDNQMLANSIDVMYTGDVEYTPVWPEPPFWIF